MKKHVFLAAAAVSAFCAVSAQAQTFDQTSTAVGNSSSATNNSNSIGENAFSDSGSNAIGSGANAQLNSVAVGTGAQAYNDGVAIGTDARSYDGGIAIGTHAFNFPGGYANNGGIAIGNNARTDGFGGPQGDGIAIGNNSYAWGGGVAVGDGVFAGPNEFNIGGKNLYTGGSVTSNALTTNDALVYGTLSAGNITANNFTANSFNVQTLTSDNISTNGTVTASRVVVGNDGLATSGGIFADGSMQTLGSVFAAGDLTSQAGSVSAAVDVNAGRNLNSQGSLSVGQDAFVSGNLKSSSVFTTDLNAGNAFASNLVGGFITSQSGIGANGKITGVADGDVHGGSLDAVNGSQLSSVNDTANNALFLSQANHSDIGVLQNDLSKVAQGALNATETASAAFDRADKALFLGVDNQQAITDLDVRTGVAVNDIQTQIDQSRNEFGVTIKQFASTAKSVDAKATDALNVGTTALNAAGSAMAQANQANEAVSKALVASTDALDSSKQASIIAGSALESSARAETASGFAVDTAQAAVTVAATAAAKADAAVDTSGAAVALAAASDIKSDGAVKVANAATDVAVVANAKADTAIGVANAADQRSTLALQTAQNISVKQAEVAVQYDDTDRSVVTFGTPSKTAAVARTAAPGELVVRAQAVEAPPEPVTLRNIAAGTQANDAVNLAQLQSSAATTLVQSTAYTDNRLATFASQTRFDLQQLRKDANAGIAGALAVNGIPQTISPGGSMVGGGVGNWNGQTAFAIGLSHASDDGRVVFKAAGSVNTRGDGGGNAGMGIAF